MPGDRGRGRGATERGSARATYRRGTSNSMRETSLYRIFHHARGRARPTYRRGTGTNEQEGLSGRQGRDGGGGVVSPDVYRLSSPCSELETLCRISWTAQHYRRSSPCTSSVLSSNSPLERGCGHPGMRPDARICGLSPRALKGAAMAPISSTYQDSSSVRLKAAQATTMKHISR